jgi:hypothetical protein
MQTFATEAVLKETSAVVTGYLKAFFAVVPKYAR